MGYLEYVASTPYSWFAVAGIFVGAALSRLTIPVRGAENEDRARSRKWAAVYTFLAVAVVAATLGVFVPDPQLVRDVQLAVHFGAVVIVSGLALRFKLIVGSMVFLIILAAAGATVLVRQAWLPVAPPATIATVRVLSGTEGASVLELVPGGEPETEIDSATIREVPSSRFGLRVEILQLSRHYFFCGMEYGVRLVELVGESQALLAFDPVGGTAGAFADLIRDNIGRIPGAEVRLASSDTVPAVVLRRYELRFRAPDGLEFRNSE